MTNLLASLSLSSVLTGAFSATLVILVIGVVVRLLWPVHRPAPPPAPAPADAPDNTGNSANDAANNDTRFLMLHQQIQAVNDNVNQLQRLFRNVKLRGSWGEVQLGAILSEMLSPAQYEANVAVDPMSSERVEFALKLPLPDQTYLWLPIDAKCPVEDFQRLQQAQEHNDTAAAQSAARALHRRLLAEAADIAAKYIRPPYSTDFALLFIPIESIYQYALTDADLIQTMERQYRVIPTGPGTISAVLNLLQVSHRSMALATSEREIWQTLSAARSEFAAFDNALGRTRKKADELTADLDNMAKRLRIIERRLSQLENAADSQKQLD